MNQKINRSILAVGAHADDIEIQLGGTLLKYRGLGYGVTYVMSTNNMSGVVRERQENGTLLPCRYGPVQTMQIRKAECARAAEALGTEAIHLDHLQRHYFDEKEQRVVELRYGAPVPEGIPDDRPSILTAFEDPQSIERLTSLILEKDPECLFTGGLSQWNIEHYATTLLVAVAFWKAVERGYQGGLLYWSEEHTFHGEHSLKFDTYVDCSRQLEAKMRLIGLHECQMPTADDLEHGHRQITLWRGKTVGVDAAEGFHWVRKPTRTSRDISGFPTPVHGELGGELLRNGR